MRKITTNPSTFQQLAVIEGQFNQNTSAEPQKPKTVAPYHEYYKVENARGFTKITVAKPSFRR